MGGADAADSPAARVVAIGPLTDVASAILLDREVIEQRVVVVWVGGSTIRPWTRGSTKPTLRPCRASMA